MFGFRVRKRKARGGRKEPRLFAGQRAGRQRAKLETSEKRPRRRRGFRLVNLAVALVIWGVLAVGGGFGYVWLTLDKKGLFQIPDREPGVMLLASDGTVLSEQGAFYGDEVRIAELPSYVPNAIIAIEDRRYRYHMGVDPMGLARALVENWRAGRVVQGGSTLTQQLAKNLFLKPDRTIERKAQEMVLAVWLENRFTKDEILQLYVNRVYFGGGATGIEKAAKRYFGKSAREVTLAEAAILAAVLKAPSAYNPLTNPKEAAARAREVIGAMTEAGFITAEEAGRSISAPLTIKPAEYVPATQYIADWAIEQLPLLIGKYDRSIVVETTIDPDLQRLAERALRKRLNEEGGKLDVSQAALVLLDPAGAIKAMVGGKSYARSQFNRVTKAKRQPGSAFKPFVYLTALEQGYSPDSVEVDEPVKIGDWEPENYRDKYLGAVTLTKALALSLNTVAAKLAFAVGPRNVADTAHRLGIASALDPNASLALGTSEVTLLELTAAFAPFANGGAAVQPFAVKRIATRDGQVLYERQGDGLGQVVSSYDLGAMNRMLRQVVVSGTARRAQFGRFEIAGKTGTSQDYRDAWFIGYTAHLIAGVWAGNDDNSPTRKVTGGSIPAAIWKDVMEPAHDGLRLLPLPGEERVYDIQPETAVLEPDWVPAEQPRKRRRVVENDDGFFGSIEKAFREKPRREKRPAEPQKKSFWQRVKDNHDGR